jgi:hypothetical protein
MEKRHRREWATINGEEIEKEKIRERDRQDNLTEAIRLLAENNSNNKSRGKNNG